MLIVSSPVRRMLSSVSLPGLLSVGEKPSPTTGGVALKALKKLNGARLCPPASLFVPTQAIGRGTIAQKERQNSKTASLGLTVDRLVGASSQHRIEAYGGFVTTSNSAVAIRNSAPIEAARLFGPLEIPGSKDSWAEYGASASFRLSEPLRLDVSAVRTAGYRGGEATSLYAGMRFRF